MNRLRRSSLNVWPAAALVGCVFFCVPKLEAVMTLAGTQYLNPAGFASVVIDTAAGFGYSTSGATILGHNQAIVQFKLSNLNIVGQISLDASQSYTWSPALIDTANHFAYFAVLNTTPIQYSIQRISLSPFGSAGALNLTSNDTVENASAIDTAGGIAYFAGRRWNCPDGPGTCTNSTPEIFRFDLKHFLVMTPIAVPTVVQSMLANPVDHTLLAVISPSSGSSEILKIDGINSNILSALVLNAGETPCAGSTTPNCGFIDPAGGFAYYGLQNGSNNTSEILQIQLNPLARGASLPLPSYWSPFMGAFDATNDISYWIVPDILPGSIDALGLIQVKMSPFTILDGIGVSFLPYSMAIDSTDQDLFIGTFGSPVQNISADLIKVALAPQYAPPPLITSLMPGTTVAKSPAFNLQVQGSGFADGSVVLWKGSPRVTTQTPGDKTLLVAAITAEDVASPDVVTVTALTPLGARATANFTITPALVPNLSAGPNPMLFSGTLGSPDPAAQPLTLSNSGTGDWNGSVTVDPSSPWISVTPAARLSVSAAIGANPGTLPVQVSVAMAGLSAGPPHTGLLHFDDGAGHTLPVTVNFTVNPQPVPKPDLVSLDPQIITAGDPPFTLLISGSNILSGATVSWGGTVKIPDAIDSSGAWLKLTIQPSDIPTPGYIQITATNPGGSPSNALPLRVVAPPKVPDLRLGPYTPLNATLSVSPQQDILFNWAVTPLASLPNSTALGIQSGNSALDNAPFKSFSAPPALSLGNFPLSVGPISVEVTATNLAGKTSAPAQAFTILTSNNADVFPNPWRADQHAGHPITFRPVTPGDTLKIFTLSGRLVNTLSVTDTFAAWSPEADRAASGVYFYTLTDSQGLQNRGKFAVIR